MPSRREKHPCCSTPPVPKTQTFISRSRPDRSALHEGQRQALLKSMPTRKAGNAFLPTRRFSKWSGTDPEPSEFSPPRLTPRRSPQTTNPSTQPYKKRARTKKQVRATRRRRQTASQLLSKHRMSPLPVQTIPSSRTVWGLLILRRSMKVTVACLPPSTTQRSSMLQTSKLPPPISPSASRPSSHFPNPSKSSFCHRARSWPQHCSPCWAPRILETKLKRSRLSTLQPPLNCVYTPLPQTEARPWNSMATHF